MITLLINGQKKEVPTSWDDLTFKQYLDIFQLQAGYKGQANSDELDLISLFLGISKQELRNAEVSNLQLLISCLEFLQEAPDFTGEVDKIGTYRIPKDIILETIGQYEDMKAIIKSDGAILYAYPKICAIYIDKLEHGDYNYNRAFALASRMQSLPAKEIIIGASFFLSRWKTLNDSTAKNSHLQKSTQKKNLLTRFLPDGAFTALWTGLRKIFAKLKRKR